MNRRVSKSLLLVLGLCFVFPAFGRKHNAQVDIRYAFLTNEKKFDAMAMIRQKELKFSVTRDTNQACYDYMMYAFSNQYRMLEEGLRINYFVGGTELNRYLDEIVTEIQDQKSSYVDYHMNYSVLIVQSSTPNAYSFGDGLIGVSTGLLARLETRSQLASVLCHEMAHDILGHHEQTLLRHAIMYTSKQIGDSIDYILEEGIYTGERMQAYLAKVYSASMRKNRMNEHQADSLGLLILTEAGFNPADATASLQKIEEPLLKHEDFSIFSYLQLHGIKPKSQWVYTGDNARLRDLVEKEVFFMDTMYSHPEKEERIKRLQGMNPSVKEENIDADLGWFEYLRINSYVQMTLEAYQSGNIALCVYNALALKKIYPEQKFSDHMIIICLCKSTRLKENLQLSLFIGHPDTAYDHGLNQVIHFMQKVSLQDISALSCQLMESVGGQSQTDIYAYTATLFSGYFCMNNDKYRALRYQYYNLYKDSFFKYDLIYLPKKKKL